MRLFKKFQWAQFGDIGDMMKLEEQGKGPRRPIRFTLLFLNTESHQGLLTT